MNMVGDASHCQSRHPIFACDSTKVGMQPILHFISYPRATASSSEDDVQQTANITVRHRIQPSLTGLLFVRKRNPAFGRRLAAPPDAGLLSNVPAGLYHSFKSTQQNVETLQPPAKAGGLLHSEA